MKFFANLFGFLLNFIYNLISNYALAIIIFCIIIKILMFPLSIKQQKNMKKTTKIQEKMKILQFKYKNDPEKLNQEMMALYKSEKINPFSGCFSAIIQIVLLLSVFYLVQSPLTYMRKIKTETIDNCYNVLKTENIVSDSRYKEIDIIREIDKIQDYKNKNNEAESIVETEELDIENDEIETENEEKIENKIEINQDDLDKMKINMNFLGIDLSKVPSQNTNDWKVYIIPILYVIISFVSMRFLAGGQFKNKKDGEEVNPMLQANKRMSYYFPILYLLVTIFAPLGLALYWLVNSILMIVEKLILNVILKDKDEEEILEVKYITEKNDKDDVE